MKRTRRYYALTIIHCVLLTFFCTAFFSPPVTAQPERKAVSEDTILYRAVPDILIDTGNGVIHLSSLWSEKPLLLVFVYSECKGVCMPYLRSFDQAIHSLGGINRDYRVLVLSFDTTDNTPRVRAFCRMAGLQLNNHYVIATSNPEGVKKLTRTAGFWYDRVGTGNQYDHPAQITGILNGQIRRVLVGSEVSAARLHEVIKELNGFYVRSYPLPDANVLFRCFQQEPQTGIWKPAWGLLILFVPFVFTSSSVYLLFCNRRRKKDSYDAI